MFKKIKDWVLGTKPVEQSTNWPHPEKSEPVVKNIKETTESITATVQVIPAGTEASVAAKVEKPKPVPANPVKKPAARNYSKKKPVKN
jgi:hypothetical protein